MANQLSLTVTLTYSPTDSPGEQVKVAPPAFSKTVTMSANGYVTATQAVGTSEELLGDGTNGFNAVISTVGYVLIKNIDDTNYCDFGRTTTVYNVRLKAGEFALFRLTPTTNTIFALANSSSVNVQYWVFEN